MRNRANLLILVAVISWANVAGVSRAESPIAPDEGVPSVSWKDAGPCVGRIAKVSGTVDEVRTAGRNNFLDFDGKSKEGFVGIVYQDNLANFPDKLEALYKGKIVRIRGRVTTHQGNPQIQIRHPSQIEVLSEMPQTKPLVKPEVKIADEITVATYNILNIFDDFDDPYYVDESTAAKPRSQLDNLAKSIRALNADVIALQEVENRGYLERFFQAFLADMGYEHIVHFEGNDTRGIDVALVSRIPVDTVTSYRHHEFPGADGKPMVFERDLLAVHLVPPKGKPFEVWVLHLKSNFEGREYAEPIRKAEAADVRKQLDARLKADPSARILVCGDFNDTPDSAMLTILRGSGATAMSTFFNDLSESNRVTYNKEPYLTMIDFILATPAMAELYVKGSYHVAPGSIEGTGSDHNPVRAAFRLSKP